MPWIKLLVVSTFRAYFSLYNTMELPETILAAIKQFSKLPGVGEKSAMRQILALTNWKISDLAQFGRAIEQLGALSRCRRCGFFAEEDKCTICKSEVRINAKSICVVESITDFLAIERSNQFHGSYFILGGVLNPLLGVGPQELKTERLLKCVLEEEVGEIILALNPSVEGDATCSYLKSVFPQEIRVERIGFGIPIGSNLDYLDPMTITKALENKRPM